MPLSPDIDPEKVACWMCGIAGVPAIEGGMYECRSCDVRWRAARTTNGKPDFVRLSPRYLDHSKYHRPAPA